MIAKNYIKFPEALRFQVELFSNGYKNSPRIMRLMTVIFDQRPDVPQWWKDLKSAERRLIKHWKKALMELFGKTEATAQTAPGEGEVKAATPPVQSIKVQTEKEFKEWIFATLPAIPATRWNPIRNPFLKANAYGGLQCGGNYRQFCPSENFAESKAFNYGFSR